MALEIERKFLVRDETWRDQVRSASRLRQGYLNDEKGCSIRVRADSERAWLNIKSATIGAQRLEFEYEIPLTDAEVLLDTLARRPLIEKWRYLVDVGEHTWEIDVFEGDNAGLVVAEIELDDPDEAFEMPAWAGLDVTEDIRYYNTSLSRHPFSEWGKG